MRAILAALFAMSVFASDGFCGQDVIVITQQKPKQQNAPAPPPEANKEKSLLTILNKSYSFEGVDITLHHIDCSHNGGKSCALYYSMQNNSGADISSIKCVAEMYNNGELVNSKSIIEISLTNKRILSDLTYMQHTPFTEIDLRLDGIRN